MGISCTAEMYEQAEKWLKDGHTSDNPLYYTMLMKNPDGVIDSLLLAFEDTYGTMQERTTTHLYTKYEEQVDAGDPELDPSLYGHALAALDDMGLIEQDTSSGKARWMLEETNQRRLVAVKQAAHDPEVQQLYTKPYAQ